MGSFRHAHSQPVSERDVQESVLTVESGPGWVDLWSPNAAVRWRISSTRDRVRLDRWTDTGPAAKARMWVGAGGAEVFVQAILLLLDGTTSVNPQDGTINVGLDPTRRAEVAARFFPADGRDTPGAEPWGQYDPLVGQHCTRLACDVPAGQTIPLGFPPEERFVASVTTLLPDTFQLSIHEGLPELSTPLWLSAATTGVSVNVGPDEHLQIFNPGEEAIRIRLLWQDFGPIRQVP